MKKLFFILLTIGFIYLIYYSFNNNNKINYVSIGDGLIRGKNAFNIENYGYNDYIKEYLEKSGKLHSFNNNFYCNKIDDLIKDIKNNRTIWHNNNEYYIKKILRESDLLVISIGMEELAYNYKIDSISDNYSYFNRMYLKIETLIKEVKKYAKGKILFLGYYNPTNYYDSKTDELFCYMDIKLNRLMMSNKISYIDLYEIVKGNRYKEKDNTPFLNIKGYEKLASIVSFYID